MRQSKVDLSSVSTASLEAFVRAVELGSFAAAARSLGVSGAAIGQHVARLERAFDVRLLQRSTRHMSVTLDGRVLYERARAIVGELAGLARLFDERDGVLRGPLRVSAPTGIARRLVAPLCARFVREHPEVSVVLDASDTIRELAAEPIDVAFRILPPVDSGVIAVRLARLDAMTVASPAYLAERGTPRHPRELAAHELVTYRHPTSGSVGPFRFRVRGRELSIALAGRLAVNDVDAGCAAAEAGAGIVQPPSIYVEDAIAAGRLVPILAAHRAAAWTLYVCHAGGRLPRRVRAFVDRARTELRRA